MGNRRLLTAKELLLRMADEATAEATEVASHPTIEMNWGDSLQDSTIP